MRKVSEPSLSPRRQSGLQWSEVSKEWSWFEICMLCLLKLLRFRPRIRLRSRISTLLGTSDDSDSGSRSRKKWIRKNYRGVMIPTLDLDPELDSWPFGNSDSGSGSTKKWNHNTSYLYWNGTRLTMTYYLRTAQSPVSWSSCSPLTWREEKILTSPPNSRTESTRPTNLFRFATSWEKQETRVRIMVMIIYQN